MDPKQKYRGNSDRMLLTLGVIFCIFGMAQYQFLLFGAAFLIVGAVSRYRDGGK